MAPNKFSGDFAAITQKMGDLDSIIKPMPELKDLHPGAADKKVPPADPNAKSAQTSLPPQAAEPASAPSAEEVEKQVHREVILPQREPATWEIKDPPADDPDPKKGQDKDSRQGNDHWMIVAASQRGQMHAHEGTFREDDFRIETAGGALLVAVADGAGSCELSRVGSKLAVETTMQVMADKVNDGLPKEDFLKFVLQNALEKAWDRLWDEAEARKAKGELRKRDGKPITFKDLSTTLLLLIYVPEHNIIAVAQVGDGLIFLEKETGQNVVLGYPELGEYSGLTYFLTSSKKDVLADKINVYPITSGIPPRMICVMTDGVADDIYPPEESLKGLIKPLHTNLGASDDLHAQETILLNILQYKRAGSFDDRTLAVVYQSEKLQAARLKKTGELPAGNPTNGETKSATS